MSAETSIYEQEPSRAVLELAAAEAGPSPAYIGAVAIVEITIQPKSTDLARDWITNHLYFNGPASPTIANFQALTDAIIGVWKLSPGVHWAYGSSGITVNAYDMADTKPRAEKGHSVYTPSSWLSDTTQARQIALCVSYYCGRNLPRYRGRVYLMPTNNAGASERPGTAILNGAMGLITATAAATAALSPTWAHCVWSSKLGDYNIVSNYWVNDVWDTQRRREPKETLRVHSP